VSFCKIKKKLSHTEKQKTFTNLCRAPQHRRFVSSLMAVWRAMAALCSALMIRQQTERDLRESSHETKRRKRFDNQHTHTHTHTQQ
jgi:hypothetical protein